MDIHHAVLRTPHREVLPNRRQEETEAPHSGAERKWGKEPGHSQGGVTAAAEPGKSYYFYTFHLHFILQREIWDSPPTQQVTSVAARSSCC